MPPQAGLLLIVAAGLRLGVLPVHLPYNSESSLRRGLGTMLRLVRGHRQPGVACAYSHRKLFITTNTFAAGLVWCGGHLRRLDVVTRTR